MSSTVRTLLPLKPPQSFNWPEYFVYHSPMPIADEELVQAAIRAVRHGAIDNYQEAARINGVSASTLRRRVRGLTRPAKEAHGHQKRLSKAQENAIVV